MELKEFVENFDPNTTLLIEKLDIVKRSLKHIVKRLACTKLQSRHSRILV